MLGSGSGSGGGLSPSCSSTGRPRPEGRRDSAGRAAVSTSPLENPLCVTSLRAPFSTVSLQTQRARAAERQEPAAQEAAAGLHGPPAPHPDRHLQGEQAPVQGDADDHLTAAGLGAQHRQQLLHERPPAVYEPLAGGARHQPRGPLFFYKHFLQSMMSPSPPCPFLDILLMTKPTQPRAHAPFGVGAFGHCESPTLNWCRVLLSPPSSLRSWDGGCSWAGSFPWRALRKPP